MFLLRHTPCSAHLQRLPVASLSRLLAVLSVATCLMSPAALLAQEPPPTVSEVDLNRYSGSWYEIARLPNRFQRQCASDTQAHYMLEGDSVRVINRCRTASGSLDEVKGRAKVVPGSGNAKLRVTFFWPFYGDYWILALADDYSDVLVGSPDRKYAWVLARTPKMTASRLQLLMDRASSLGFDTSAFIATQQASPLPAVPRSPEESPSPSASPR